MFPDLTLHHTGQQIQIDLDQGGGGAGVDKSKINNINQ